MAPAPIVLFDAYRLTQPPATTLEERRRQWDESQALACLQGIVNRKGPRLYLRWIGERGATDRFWWSELTRPGGWMHGRATEESPSLDDLLRRFRGDHRGLVVWDERVPATALLAASYAATERLIPVRFDPADGSLYRRLTGMRLPVRKRLIEPDGSPMFTGNGLVPGTLQTSTGSPKGDVYAYLAKNVRFDGRFLGYYPDAFWLSRPNNLPLERAVVPNQDYIVSRGGAFFDLGPWDDVRPDDEPNQPLGNDLRALQTVLLAARARARNEMVRVSGFTPWDLKYTDFTGGAKGAVQTEWRYAEVLSNYDACMDADAPGLGAMANGSFFRWQPLKARYAQPAVTERSLRARGWLDERGRTKPLPFVAIYAGDYDAAAWMYQRLPDLWTEPGRGEIPISWAFNPNLAERFPAVFDWVRRTATPRDAFVAGDSGAGYLNPGALVPPRRWSGLPSGLEKWERWNRPWYDRFDLRVTGFVIDGDAPAMTDEVRAAYARFSPGGVVAQKIPEVSETNGVPFVRMTYDLGDSTAGAKTIAEQTRRGEATFRVYRTILWGPKGLVELVRGTEKAAPDVVFVTLPELMELARRR